MLPLTDFFSAFLIIIDDDKIVEIPQTLKFRNFIKTLP